MILAQEGDKLEGWKEGISEGADGLIWRWYDVWRAHLLARAEMMAQYHDQESWVAKKKAAQAELDQLVAADNA